MKLISSVLLFSFVIPMVLKAQTSNPPVIPYPAGPMALYVQVPYQDESWVRIEASFDGHPRLCRLDTGSDMIVVPSSNYFSQFKAKDHIWNVGMNGSRENKDVIKLRIECAGIDLSSAGAFRRSQWNGDQEPIMGEPIYKDHELVFDFGQGCIAVGEKRPWPLRSLVANNRGFLEIPVEVVGNRAVALWDTGCQMTIINKAYYDRHRDGFVKLNQVLTLTDTNGGQQVGQAYQCSRLAVGDHIFKNLKVLVIDLSSMFNVNKSTDKCFYADIFLGLDCILNADWYFNTRSHTWAMKMDAPDRLMKWKSRRNTFPLLPRTEGVLIDPLGYVGAEESAKLKDLLTRFSKGTGADIRVIIIPSEGNWNLNDYAKALADKWHQSQSTQACAYMIFSLSSHAWYFEIYGQKLPDSQGITDQDVNGCMNDMLQKIRLKELNYEDSFRYFMQKFYDRCRAKGVIQN